MSRFVPLAGVLTLSTLFAVAVVELGLRASGYRPWRTFRTNPIEPTFHDPDPELGWVLRPGHWRYGPYVRGGAPIEVTILPDRSRRTRPHPDGGSPPARPEVLVLGCSFTFGWAVGDQDTWPWRLQSRRPDLRVRNFGTGAYGTFQALLLLERVLASGARPARVVYGYIPEHNARNVAAPGWFWVISAFSGQNVATLPYATLDANGRLVRHPPAAYPVWPLREWSAAITFLQDRWFVLSTGRRAADADEVTRQLIAEMNRRCRSAGVPFSLLLLKVGVPRRDAILPLAQAEGIDLIDCDHPLKAGDSVPGEVHPNGAVHRRWGDCVAAALEG